jgi:hypothetical protein
MQSEITPAFLNSQANYGKFAERFWRRVVKTDSCWLWTGSKTGYGYGLASVSLGSRRVALGAHSASWIMHNGPIPEGLCVLHNCPGGDNPACVNPDHLWLGTKKQNTHDMMSKGRMVIGRRYRGEDSVAAKLTEGTVRKIRIVYSECPKPRKKGGKGYARLGREFGLSDTLIKFIVTRKIWKHI